MMFFYNMVMSAARAVVYPWGRLKATAGEEVWRGRLALIPNVGPKDLWLHAASVGEVKVIGYLIDYLQQQSPSVSIHVTVTTPAGFKTAVSSFDQSVTVTYLPLDAKRAVRRTLDLIDPKMIVIAETEIWPRLITEASERNIPVVLVNGRMSKEAFKKYRLIRSSVRKLLSRYERFFFKTVEDRDRYGEFGVSADKMVVTGDMKFDAPLLKKSPGRIHEVRSRAGVADDAFFLVAGSTRSGEDEILLNVYQSLKKEFLNLRLLLAPRHLDRLDEVERLLDERGFWYSVYGRDSDSKEVRADSIVLVDRMGLLNELYLAADLAFVGGTLTDVGGHNILEPVWARTPVVFGPFLDNVREAAEYVLEHNYGAKVNSQDEFRAVLADVMNGERTFGTRTYSDVSESPTAQVGHYLLERLKDA